MRITNEKQNHVVVVVVGLLALFIGWLVISDIHPVSIITPPDDVLFNCTALCIQQFENATKNVYISPELQRDVEQYCFKSCVGG